jgi:hypothetical protein
MGPKNALYQNSVSTTIKKPNPKIISFINIEPFRDMPCVTLLCEDFLKIRPCLDNAKSMPLRPDPDALPAPTFPKRAIGAYDSLAFS